VDPISGFTVGITTQSQIAKNQKNNWLYVVYDTPQFNPNGQAGAAIQFSKDGGLTWSEPRPVNPNSLSAQAFLPSVSVAKDGTVAVLFYDFRNYQPGDKSLKTDVWVSFFNKNLKFKGEVRLTPNSFDSRQAIRRLTDGDFYLADYVKIQAVGNDFVAAFPITNPPYGVQPSPIPGKTFLKDFRNRQNVVFTKIIR
jgi:hypothetical protein